MISWGGGGEASLCVVGPLAGPLASAHRVPAETLPLVVTTRISPDIARCPLGGKIALS